MQHAQPRPTAGHDAGHDERSAASSGYGGESSTDRPGTKISTDRPGTEMAPITALALMEGPRLGGEDPAHTQLLAETDAELPPILVHRPTMRIIDGLHRVRAAQLRGRDTITVEFFDGSEAEAFVLAVERNIAHGLPLSQRDRKTAAVRILRSYPDWSDRRIARSTGLAAGTVSSLRRRLSAQLAQANKRIGQDGRVRPVDNAQRRERAAQMLAEYPDTPLREVAKGAGISLSTAHNVRKQIRSGNKRPYPENGQPAQKISAPLGARGNQYPPREAGKRELQSTLQDLKNDPSITLNIAGRNMLRWLNSQAIQSDDWKPLLKSIPPHRLGTVGSVSLR